MKDKVRTINTVNGQVQYVPRSYLRASNNHLEVGEEVKSFDPKLYSPKSAEEFRHVHARLLEPAVVKETSVEEITINEQEN